MSIAAFVMTAFVFRLVFLNTCLFSSFQQAVIGAPTLFSTGNDRKTSSEFVAVPALDKYALAQSWAEKPESNEKLSKIPVFLLTSFLFGLFKNLISLPNTLGFFHSIKCRLFPKRYLALSVIRVWFLSFPTILIVHQDVACRFNTMVICGKTCKSLTAGQLFGFLSVIKFR